MTRGDYVAILLGAAGVLAAGALLWLFLYWLLGRLMGLDDDPR